MRRNNGYFCAHCKRFVFRKPKAQFSQEQRPAANAIYVEATLVAKIARRDQAGFQLDTEIAGYSAS